MSEPFPESLSHLRHYLDTEAVRWHEVEPGTSVASQAHDVATRENGVFMVEVVATEQQDNGLTRATVELQDSSFSFVDLATRAPRRLPAGTLMKAGVAATHYPIAEANVVDFSGIVVGRDFSFEYALTPQGELVDGIVVPKVQRVLYSQMDSDYRPSERLSEYKQIIGRSEVKASSEADQATAALDAHIQKRIPELLSEDQTVELLAIITDFSFDGRLVLANLIEHANDAGVVDKFLAAIQGAIEKEFKYTMPGMRGMPTLPATARGWEQIVRDLGLQIPG